MEAHEKDLQDTLVGIACELCHTTLRDHYTPPAWTRLFLTLCAFGNARLLQLM